MPYGCDCGGCEREIRHLKDQLRDLEHALDSAKRDVQDEIDRLNRRLDALRSDVGELYHS
jgi:uncharacterized protein YlxW (UPF0749 family)